MNVTVIFTDPNPPRPPKVVKKVIWPPNPLKNNFFYLGRLFLNSLEIVIFYRNWSKKCKLAQIFIISLYSCPKTVSFIMPYDCPMLLCIKLSIYEQISIRYTLKSLIPNCKTATPWKKLLNFLKNFIRALEKSFFMEVALDYHFTWTPSTEKSLWI